VFVAATLATGVAIVLALPIVARFLRRRFDPFEPIVIFAVAYGVIFVARPASMLVRDELTYAGVDIRETLARALFLALVGAVAFVGAYEVTGRALAARLPAPTEIGPRTGLLAAGVLVVLALVALLGTVWREGVLTGLKVLLGGQTAETRDLLAQAGAYGFNTVMLLIPAGLLLAGLALRRRSRALAALAAAPIGLALTLLVPIGGRTFLLPLLGGLLVLLYVSRGARPRIWTVLALGFAAFVVAYVLDVVRTPWERDQVGPVLREVLVRPDKPVRATVDGEDADMAPAFAAALTAVPSQLEYRYGGAVLGDLATRPIPRALWAGKPRSGVEQVVETIWPPLVTYFNPALSSVFYFYWDFSVFGVLAGMAIFGLACRTLYEWFRLHRGVLSAQLVFALAIWLILPAVRNTPVDAIVLACFVALPVVVVERLIAVRRHRSAARGLSVDREQRSSPR
jgi:hypothetical protein